MDYEIELSTLESKKSELEELKQKGEDIYNELNSSYLSTGISGTEISALTEKIKTPTERIKKGLTNSNTWYTNYTTELTALEDSLAAFSGGSLTAPTEFNGKFEDMFGKVTIPTLKTDGDTHANATVKVSENSDGTITVEALGSKYTIADTEGELYEYYKNVILSQSLYQSDSKAYDDQCLGFSYNYAYGLYTNDRNIGPKTIRNGTSYGNHFKRFVTNDQSEYLTKIYDEITAGRPVVIQVTGSRKNKTRHYVAAIGFKDSVKSASDLKTTDLLIMDVYDGKIKNTVDKNSSSGRCVVKGTELKKGSYPYGYEMYYINT